MPRAKDVTLSRLMQKAQHLHDGLAKMTAAYNEVIAKANTLKHVQTITNPGDVVFVQGDACQVLLKRTAPEGSCTLKVLRKFNDPENAFIDEVKDYQVTSTDSGGDSDEYI